MILCGRSSNRTRAFSPRQLPTDHDYAVSTREYQSDQPSRQPPRPRLAPSSPLEPEEEKPKQRYCLTGRFISELGSGANGVAGR
jgi:hypothetical protein